MLVRLFSEQCEHEKEPNKEFDSKTNYKIIVKKKTDGITMQSPYDPDASYGHKGAGYSLHIAETCNNPEKSEIITDYDVIRCPMGHKPVDHRILSGNNTTRRSLHAIFDGDTCRSCKMLDQCPVRAPNHRDCGCQARDTVGNFRLEITPELRLRDQMYANQQTDEWKDRYKIRSGIEATNSELQRSYGIGKLRVRRAKSSLPWSAN